MGACLGKEDSNSQTLAPQKQQVGQQQILAERQYKSKQASQMTEQDKATIQLKQVQDQLNKRLQQIDKGQQEAESEAKTHLKNGNKQRAKFALERKQLYGKYEENVLNQDRTIKKTILELQETYDNVKVANTLKKANKLMIDINKAIDIDSMQDAMGNLQELEMNNNQFNDLYQQYVGADNEDIARQVDILEAELFKEDINNHEANIKMPIIQNKPNTAINSQTQQHEQINTDQPVQIVDKQKEKQNDDMDDQLAMLA